MFTRKGVCGGGCPSLPCCNCAEVGLRCAEACTCCEKKPTCRSVLDYFCPREQGCACLYPESYDCCDGCAGSFGSCAGSWAVCGTCSAPTCTSCNPCEDFSECGECCPTDMWQSCIPVGLCNCQPCTCDCQTPECSTIDCLCFEITIKGRGTQDVHELS
ncbi:unnamed protein product [Meganyctiphanes norvegica]|uniref:Uncharacterized protein n=1 Tax=Meganyctiphanes norvegica TaxID=48144 RepID=A0AAV2QD02_MEGNR